MATCYRHPGRETGVSCSNCGNPICPDCMTPTPVGMRCPECSRDKTKVRTIQHVRRSDEPRVTYVIMALCVIGLLATGSMGFGRGGGNELFYDLALIGQAIDGTQIVGVAEGQYWRLVTSGFLHADLLHIGLNMYLLYMLGQMMEPALGMVRFGLLYLAALLSGSAGALLLSDPQDVTVGASGAVFGLMGAAFFEMRARGIDPMTSGIGPLILINLAISFLVPGISIGGHLGGLIGGALVVLAYQQADRVRQPLLAYAGALAVGAASVAVAIAVAPA